MTYMLVTDHPNDGQRFFGPFDSYKAGKEYAAKLTIESLDSQGRTVEPKYSCDYSVVEIEGKCVGVAVPPSVSSLAYQRREKRRRAQPGPGQRVL